MQYSSKREMLHRDCIILVCCVFLYNRPELSNENAAQLKDELRRLNVQSCRCY